MSRFVGDARDFRRADEPRVLMLTEDLLDELDVADATRSEQEGAVRAWLADNTPNQVLALSLQKDGFLDEKLSNNLSNEPRRTGTDDAGRGSSPQRSDLHQHGRSRTKPDGRNPRSSGS